MKESGNYSKRYNNLKCIYNNGASKCIKQKLIELMREIDKIIVADITIPLSAIDTTCRQKAKTKQNM